MRFRSCQSLMIEAFAAVALFLSLVEPVFAQPAPPPTPVKHRITCAACRIELTKVLTLGTPNDPDLVGAPRTISTIARDSKGRFYVQGYEKVKVVVFGPDGKYLTAIGREGEGPGEFGRPNSSFSGVEDIWIGQGDTLHVFHSRSKIDVFDPNWRHVRTVVITSSDRSGQAILRNGNILLSARLRTPEQIGHPFHLLSPTGSPIRSFGGDDRPVGSGSPNVPRQRIGIANDGSTFWSYRDYNLQNWSAEGRLLRNFEIQDISWWPPPPALRIGEVPSGARPGVSLASLPRVPGAVNMVGVDSAGIIWMNGILYGSSTGGRNSADTYRLEAVDPNTGAILASQIHPNPPQLLIRGTNLTYSTTESADGLVYFTVFRLRLIRP